MPNPPRPARTRLPRLTPHHPIGILLGLSAFSLVAAAARPAEAQAAAIGTTVSGTVRAVRSDTPLPNAEVAVAGTGVVVHTDLDGRFKISGLAPGSYRLVARSEGYREQEREVELRDGVTEAEASFSLDALARFSGDVVVVPSRYSLYQEAPSARASLSREEVERMPHFADDVFRAARWLPGATGEDVSSTMNVRGGVADESLILLDGVEISEAFPPQGAVQLDQHHRR